MYNPINEWKRARKIALLNKAFDNAVESGMRIISIERSNHDIERARENTQLQNILDRITSPRRYFARLLPR